MSIDFREFYAGQCFGAMSCSSGAYGSDQVGSDIDEELESGVDEELFGANSSGKSKRLEANFTRLKSLYKKAIKEHISHKQSKRLKNIKSKMAKVMHKIVSVWRTMESDAKKEWAKSHKGPAKHPSVFIKKYGPHRFQ